MSYLLKEINNNDLYVIEWDSRSEWLSLSEYNKVLFYFTIAVTRKKKNQTPPGMRGLINQDQINHKSGPKYVVPH